MRQASPANLNNLSFLQLGVALLTAIAIGFSSIAEASAANSRYAAIVIDANTGKTLFSANADAARFPASLTKMMTLYLVFERLASGKLQKTTQVPFSQYAAGQPPTKLGIKAGQSVSVETIIYSMVTKSANDSATAIGEFIGGSQAGFARLMNAKARALGMTNTHFENASGLPDPQQHSSARDLALLGLALREHFPQYYPYFSTHSFTYGRQRMANHNHLLSRVKGMDGIKTGYTRASGFNLVSSVADGNRRIVAVVMGGQTARARDDHMADLIANYLPKASGRSGGGDLIAKAKEDKADDTRIAAAAPIAAPAPTPERRPEKKSKAAAAQPADETKAAEEPVVQAYAEPVPQSKAAVLDAVDPIATSATKAPSGWAIQVASSPDAQQAKSLLTKTGKDASSILADARGYTVPFEKGGVTYYRVRFGGFASKSAAWDACGALKKKKIACYAILE
ncbi:D-alanyl-D-alanine carboxypeptidase [Mesorhizobium sp. BAC0120]|uniref:D-alanyl-D-alanine carboxypeptidase n=1 Tax=Mesorhizobium sp. BAC0120 TaxID=3090670 RepID=UPI00298D3654|nr:D-alanyl-D-alanine carboxypeptidase [Mesorhizobium sp. BAC0120]MDW6022803.1 D-alanyl-D-alanine carboxypeptidase [Mesorhizobium sp. BAC0120]